MSTHHTQAGRIARLNALWELVRRNPGESRDRIEAVMTIQYGISEERFAEYVRILERAGRVVTLEGALYPPDKVPEADKWRFDLPETELTQVEEPTPLKEADEQRFVDAVLSRTEHKIVDDLEEEKKEIEQRKKRKRGRPRKAGSV